MSAVLFLGSVRLLVVIGLTVGVILGAVSAAFVIRNIIAEWRRP